MWLGRRDPGGVGGAGTGGGKETANGRGACAGLGDVTVDAMDDGEFVSEGWPPRLKVTVGELGSPRTKPLGADD